MKSSFDFALVGKGISHSQSPLLFKKMDPLCTYQLKDFDKLSKENLLEVVRKFDGVNITAPFKKVAFELCDNSNEFKHLESVNCLRFCHNKVIGLNTDAIAIQEIMKSFSNERLIILGDGAMSKIFQYYFGKKIEKVLSRKNQNLNIEELNGFDGLVINTISREFDLSTLLCAHTVKLWDLNYNTHYSQKIDFDYKDGKQMLELQAKFAFEFFTQDLR